MKQQITQWITDKTKSCVRCGYCCKKATCHIGLTHGAKPTNCIFLIGDAPGEYACFLVEKKVYPNIKMHLAIGDGCCEPLFNRYREIVILNEAL